MKKNDIRHSLKTLIAIKIKLLQQENDDYIKDLIKSSKIVYRG